jgi:hypothetical protein
MKDPFEKFVASHPREPHPAKLSWQAADQDHNRAHWLVIDQYGPARGESPLPDINTISSTAGQIYDYTRGPMFPVQKPSGRVDLVRNGNVVEAKTVGVTAFTLLVSPDAFDLSQPVKVIANGKEVFNARVQKDLKTLLKWAARDNDRTMLYGAEVKIKLASK